MTGRLTWPIAVILLDAIADRSRLCVNQARAFIALESPSCKKGKRQPAALG
jgi:hypothetical protein